MMKNLYLTFALFITLFSFSNAQEIEWQNTIGGSGEDNVFEIQSTFDGGYIIAGASNSNISGDKTENCKGSFDIWIIKLDSIGDIEWEKTIGGSDDDYAYSVRQTLDGGYIVGACSESDSSGDKTVHSKGLMDYWVLKLDPSGLIQWQKVYGGDLWDQLEDIRLTADGGYIVCGFSLSGVSGDKSDTLNGKDDFWVLKLDSAGTVEWDRGIGGTDDDRPKAIHQTADGGYIVGGTSWSGVSGQKTEPFIGFSDYWVVKFDSLGSIQWQNTITGSLEDYLWSLEPTIDGGFIVGGYSFSDSSYDKSENCKGGEDYWIVKLDSSGNILWDKTIGGAGYDIHCQVHQTPDGNYDIIGSTLSNLSGDITEDCVGKTDLLIVRLDSSGTIIFQNTIGGVNEEIVPTGYPAFDNNLIVAVNSNSNVSGDKTENSNGGKDIWIVKIDGDVNLITGKIYADLNSDTDQDVTDPDLPGRKVDETITGRITFSNQFGDFNLVVPDTGIYSIQSQSLPWYNPVPSSRSVIFTGLNETDSLNDFAFQPSGSYTDASITLTPLSPFRSGFTATYQINYGNYGTTASAPTLCFYPDTNVTFQSATQTPTQITPDSVTWTLPALTPFQSGSIIITVSVNLGLTNGTLINSSARIDPLLTDANVLNNTSDWPIFTTGSYDPNDILVNRYDFTTTELSANPWLEYIIRFQNTGNDTAFTVKILNPVDTNKLEISSIEFVNASHPVNLNWINYQRNMEFKFENILLPDSNTNEPLSHGFVRYRIQPKTTLNAGDTIPNFAAIYFDFNEPVITNTAETIIILPTGVASASPTQGKLLVFPNPAENSINISGIHLENGKAQLMLTDIYGKLIIEKTILTSSTTLETDQLSNGVYLIQSGGMRATFVKQ